MISHFRHFTTLPVLLALVACSSPAASGGGGGAARVDSRALTPGDVELYARVMRQAATSGQGGAAPDPRADDRAVRAERLDAVRYAVVRDRIEAVLRPSPLGDRTLRPADDGTAPPALLTAEQLDFRRRARALARADSLVLAPRWAELRQLLARVRGAAPPVPGGVQSDRSGSR